MTSERTPSLESAAIDRNRYLLVSLVLAFGLAALVQAPRLLNPYLVEEDFRSQYWVHRYRNPELFSQEDLSWRGFYEVDVGAATVFVQEASPGYSLLMMLGSNVWPPELFHKLLAFPLILIAAYYSFRIGQQMGGANVGLALSATLVVLNLASSTELSVVGGLHRSFAIPLLLALLYYLMNGRTRAAAATVALVGLIYLPLFPVASLTYFLAQVRVSGDKSIAVQWRRLVPLATALVVVGLAVSPSLVRQLDKTQGPGTGEAAEAPHLLDDPRYSAEGRSPLFESFPFIGRGGFFTHGEDALIIVIMISLAIGQWALLKGRRARLHRVFKLLLTSSVIGYASSWLAILATSSFLLYLPSRHLQFSLFLVTITFVTVNTGQAVGRATELLAQHHRRLPALVAPLALAALGLAVFLPRAGDGPNSVYRSDAARGLLVGMGVIAALLSVALWKRPTREVTVPKVRQTPAIGWIAAGLFFIFAVPTTLLYPQEFFYSPNDEQMRLYRFLQALPVDSIIAGNPCLLDDVPFYAKRSVVMSCERFRPDQTLIVESLLGYYGETPEAVLAYCRRYGVDYLVGNETSFDAEVVARGEFFFEPYNSQVAADILSREQFALAEAPGRIYQEGPVFVLPCTAEALAVGE